MKHPVKALFLGGLFLIALSILVYQLPPVQSRLGWRIDIAKTSLRTLLHPIGAMPTAVPVAELPAPVLHLTPGPSPTATPPAPTPSLSPTRSLPTPTPPPTATPEPLPERMLLEAPRYETQDWNNCGPASLALYLRYYGWSGDQFTISDLIKPLRNDRNVNIDELAQYVLDNLPGYDVAIRVGGTPELLKQFIAAGIPVMIEESFYLDEAFWYNDDRWAGHYLLVTGYDDASGTFVTQDTFVAPNRRLTYDQLNQNWQSFNRAYLLVFPSERSA
ncbi:MAG: C39 family peptidase, partial [Anaerolineaceae bacterium]|nr:C39 family peptidase [Anaerolineaceae bacterium]